MDLPVSYFGTQLKIFWKTECVPIEDGSLGIHEIELVTNVEKTLAIAVELEIM